MRIAYVTLSPLQTVLKPDKKLLKIEISTCQVANWINKLI